MIDDVNNPEHYTIAKGFEVIDVIEAFDLGPPIARLVVLVISADQLRLAE